MILELDTLPGVELRPARPGDYRFAETLYFESTRPLLQALGTWDRVAVTRRFKASYKRHPSQVLRAEGGDIGWLQVSRGEPGFHVHQMHLVKAWRNRGIGTQLIRSIKAHAEGLGLPVTLNVIRGNPAIALYMRLGFRTVDEDTELFRMRWDPPAHAEAGEP